jgi:hypothetical protein
MDFDAIGIHALRRIFNGFRLSTLCSVLALIEQPCDKVVGNGAGLARPSGFVRQLDNEQVRLCSVGPRALLPRQH